MNYSSFCNGGTSLKVHFDIPRTLDVEYVEDRSTWVSNNMVIVVKNDREQHPETLELSFKSRGVMPLYFVNTLWIAFNRKLRKLEIE